MPDSYFDPLPEADPNRDKDVQWLSLQTVSFQKIITGTLQASQVLESSDFVSGTSGWQIDGDGNAEFNDITVRGDIVSANWDGTEPLALSSRDTGASVGFGLDSSEGAAQFEGSVWIGGTLTVDGATSLESTLTMGTNGKWRTAVSGERIEISNADANQINFYHKDGGTPGDIELGTNSTGDGSHQILALKAPAADADDFVELEMWSGADGGSQDGGSPRIVVKGGAGLTDDVQFRFDDGTEAIPSIAFDADGDTGIYRFSGNLMAFTMGGQHMANFRNGGSGSSVSILDGLTDVGNHETLRLNRGTGSGTQFIGYYSSWLDTKTNIKGLDDPHNPWWKREWFMDLDPISSRKKKKGHFRDQEDMRTLSFYMENLIEHTNLLTTKGIRVGDSPDEHAILAVTVDYVQHLEHRIAALEAAR